MDFFKELADRQYMEMYHDRQCSKYNITYRDRTVTIGFFYLRHPIKHYKLQELIKISRELKYNFKIL